MLRIALVGKNRTAKTWVGNTLHQKHRMTHKRLGEPIERFVKNTHWYLERGRGKVFSWEQKLAIYDFFYKLEPEIWVNYMEARLRTQRTEIVVSDVRYISELEFLRDKLGFKIVRVYSMAPKLRQITAGLGKNYAPGTLYLAETYAKDFTEKIKADYSMTWDPKNRIAARESLAQIVESLRAES